MPETAATGFERVVIGDCTLYRGDCLEVLPTIEAGSVDAVVTDPPYNVGFKYNGDNTGDKKQDYEAWCHEWFNECLRVSPALILTPGIANLKQWLNKDPRWVAAWAKSNSMKRCTLGFNCWEPICVWGKPKLKYYRDLFDAPIAIDKTNQHPCPKPQKLLNKIVEAFSEPGATIIDPFMGSGTTGVACARSGRKFIGIELDKSYVDIAVNRIEAEYASK